MVRICNLQILVTMKQSRHETIKTCIKDGFTIHDGHPSFDKTYTEPVNAKQFAAELIKHNYRAGWKLPDMPR